MKPGSSYISVAYVSSKFCPIFNVVILLMLYKSLAVTNPMQLLKIMRYNFRKKGAICVKVAWALRKCKESPFHCQKFQKLHMQSVQKASFRHDFENC